MYIIPANSVTAEEKKTADIKSSRRKGSEKKEKGNLIRVIKHSLLVLNVWITLQLEIRFGVP